MIPEGQGPGGRRVAPARTYVFGPLQRRGLVAGWRGGQIASVAVGLLVGVAVLRADPGVVGGAVALVPVAVSAAVAAWPVAGRTPEEWAPVVVRWILGGGLTCPSPMTALPKPTARRAAIWDEVDIVAVEPAPGSTGRAQSHGGVVRDRRAGTMTAVLAIRGHTFALLGPEEQDRRIAGWAAALAAVAQDRSEICRIQWTAASRPDDGRTVRAYLEERASLPEAHLARRSYVGLLSAPGCAVSHHEVLLAVQVAARGRSTDRSAGPDAVARVQRATQQVARMLADADIVVEGVLGPDAIAGVLRAATHPGALPGDVGPPDRAVRGAPGVHRSGGPPGRAIPVPEGWAEGWDCLRTGATWHVTYWIAEWPRLPVPADFLAPLLLGSVRRTVSVVMEPVDQRTAARATEQARTSQVADTELRRRGGFLPTARRSRESDALARREAELADGHGSYRFSGYVTVTATSPGALRDACGETERTASQARIELRRLWGDQGRGFAATLPLGRGVA